MQTMDPNTHAFAIRWAVIGAVAADFGGTGAIAWLAFQHDGVYASWLFWITFLNVLAVLSLILGAPFVAQLAAALGLRFALPAVPVVPVPAPPIPTPPDQSGAVTNDPGPASGPVVEPGPGPA